MPRDISVSDSPRLAVWKRGCWESNLQPADRKSSALSTTPPRTKFNGKWTGIKLLKAVVRHSDSSCFGQTAARVTPTPPAIQTVPVWRRWCRDTAVRSTSNRQCADRREDAPASIRCSGCSWTCRRLLQPQTRHTWRLRIRTVVFDTFKLNIIRSIIQPFSTIHVIRVKGTKVK